MPDNLTSLRRIKSTISDARRMKDSPGNYAKSFFLNPIRFLFACSSCCCRDHHFTQAILIFGLLFVFNNMIAINTYKSTLKNVLQ